MQIALIIAIIIVIVSIPFYPKWSWKQWNKRAELNSQHKDFYPILRQVFIG